MDSKLYRYKLNISGIYAYKLKNKFTYNIIFSALIFIIIGSILTTSFINSYLGLIPLMIAFISFGLVEPLTLGYLHHSTESRIRATVESFQSLILRIFTIVFGLIFGYFSTRYSIFIGFRVLSVILAAYSIYYFSFKNKHI